MKTQTNCGIRLKPAVIVMVSALVLGLPCWGEDGVAPDPAGVPAAAAHPASADGLGNAKPDAGAAQAGHAVTPAGAVAGSIIQATPPEREPVPKLVDAMVEQSLRLKRFFRKRTSTGRQPCREHNRLVPA